MSKEDLEKTGEDEAMRSTRESQRKVRIATGAMCRCRKCYCCAEWLRENPTIRQS
jgi:hypothetical protein